MGMPADGGRRRGLLPVAGRGRGRKKVVSADTTPVAIFISDARGERGERNVRGEMLLLGEW